MKRLARRDNHRKARSKTATIPSPTRGLNARDPLALLRPTDALVLDNVICRPSYVEIRKGRQEFVTGFTDPVETLMPYAPVLGTVELWAIAGGEIFDASIAGPAPAPAVTGLTNSYWNHAQVSNVAGNFLLCCNGVDQARIYNGATWAVSGFTGLSLNLITQYAVWKRRVWCVEKNSFRAWYGASDAIAGALTSFNFSGIFKRGGKLVAILNWTIDGGQGVDDHFVAVTSSGEVAIYKGTDPAVAGSFSLVGVYYVGAPVGERFYAQYGGDILMLTADGLIPLSRYLQSQTIDRRSDLTDRIQDLISSDISASGAFQGWEVHVYFNEGFVLLQVPTADPTISYQYVMDLISGGWSRFTISPAKTWAVQNNLLFMGDATRVFNAWVGGLDDGQPISYVIIPAFSYFQTPTQLKKFNLSRWLIQADTVPRYRTQFLNDFNLEYITQSIPLAIVVGGLWDTGDWDITTWDAPAVYLRNWYALAGMGYAATQVIYGNSVGEVLRFVSVDYVYEIGGLL